jgi:hypothetical protein
METLDRIFGNFPQHIWREGQHTIRLEKNNEYFWGIWNGYTNFADVYTLNGSRYETLSLDDPEAWVSEKIFLDYGYTLLNLANI